MPQAPRSTPTHLPNVLGSIFIYFGLPPPIYQLKTYFVNGNKLLTSLPAKISIFLLALGGL